MSRNFSIFNASAKSLKPADVKVRESFEHLDMKKVKTRNIFLQANAGGGKTHSVIEFIKNHSDLNILAMSHTKAAKDEIIDRIKKGLRTMPGNITVKTFDGFAWDNAREVLPVAPDDYKWCMNGSGEWFTKMILNKCREQNISTAECLSRRRRVQSTHALNRHILLEKYVQKSYDIVIIDEAQDLCTVALKFLEECRRCSRFVIYVGDEKQCIYQPECIFAKDITDVTKFQFTHTFRYDGEQILNLINHSMKPEARHTASMIKRTLVTYSGYDTFRRKCGQTTVLVTRWNDILKYDCAKMFIAANKKQSIRHDCKKHEECMEQKEIFGKLPLAAKIKRGSTTAMRFNEWMTDNDMAALLDYESPKWEKISKMLDLNDKNKPNHRTADHIKTIHQMKGVETKNIYMDISCLPFENTTPATLAIKENLYYVALTRATENVGCMCKYHPYKFSRWFDAHLEVLLGLPVRLKQQKWEEYVEDIQRSNQWIPNGYVPMALQLTLKVREKRIEERNKREREAEIAARRKKREREEEIESRHRKRLKEEAE